MVAETRRKATGGKRGNNEGTIRKRADGRWEAMITLPGGRGRKSLYGKSRAEVARKLTEARRSVDQGITVPLGRMTLASFMAQWLSEVIKLNLRDKTYHSYEQVTRVHILPNLGKVLLSELTPLRLQRLLNEKAGGPLSPRSVQIIHAVLRQALGHAERMNYIGQNPLAAKRVPAPRAPRHEAPAISPDDARSVLAALRGDRLEALVTAALAVGLRQGEALGLTWKDINFGSGTVTIRHQLQRIDGEYQLVEPKSRSGRRQIAVPTTVLDALRALKVQQLEERLAAGSEWRGNPFDLVFTSRTGWPLDGVNVTRTFQRRLAAAGLSRLRFHDLRHGAASLLLAEGVHPRVVMEVLGHSQISLTLGTYSHVIPQLTRNAADRMDAVLTANR